MIDYIILHYIGRTLARTLSKVTHFLGQRARATEVSSISNLLFGEKNHLIQFPFHGILSLEIKALQVKKSNQTPKSHLFTSDKPEMEPAAPFSVSHLNTTESCDPMFPGGPVIQFCCADES